VYNDAWTAGLIAGVFPGRVRVPAGGTGFPSAAGACEHAAGACEHADEPTDQE
jgi:hypothetical protein